MFGQLPLAPGATLKLAADDFKFTEGPAVDPEGNVYFTDQPNDRILRWSFADGKVETFLQPCGRSNGLHFDPEGRLIACADEKNQLWRIDVRTKKVEVLLDQYEGKLLNAPNDVWVHPDGGMYFTDPYYPRAYWKGREKSEQARQRVYFLPKGAANAVVADEELVQPNGIVGSGDGKLLFVADIGDSKIYQYDIASDGTVKNRKLFCGMGSDGMAHDSRGNLYLTGKGVIVFGPDGKKIGEIPVDETWTANVCFGGPERKTLFITAMDSVYTIEMAVPGGR